MKRHVVLGVGLHTDDAEGVAELRRRVYAVQDRLARVLDEMAFAYDNNQHLCCVHCPPTDEPVLAVSFSNLSAAMDAQS